MSEKKENELQKLNLREEGVARNKAAVLKILANNACFIATACKQANITRKMFYTYMKNDPEFREAVEVIEEQRKDFVERKIMEKIEEGDTSMLIFYAKTKMKDRGYVERTEITGKDGDALQPIVGIVIHTPNELPPDRN